MRGRGVRRVGRPKPSITVKRVKKQQQNSSSKQSKRFRFSSRMMLHEKNGRCVQEEMIPPCTGTNYIHSVVPRGAMVLASSSSPSAPGGRMRGIRLGAPRARARGAAVALRVGTTGRDGRGGDGHDRGRCDLQHHRGPTTCWSLSLGCQCQWIEHDELKNQFVNDNGVPC